MLAPLLVAATITAAPTATVEVVEFYTQKPIVGAKVTLREESGTLEVSGVTAAKGKARLSLPHLGFTFVSATKAGYLTDEELAPYRSLLHQQYLDRREKLGEDGLLFRVWLVPASWPAAHVKVRTREQALAITNDWARDCAAKGPTSLELKNTTWIATYPCMEVRVSMETGEAYPKTPDVATATPLYPPEEALADALSSPLKLVGTGVWPGRYRIPSCLYRNDTVFVVNGYCTTKEIESTSVTVLHPTRGVVAFYAEAKQPISALAFDDYSQWRFGANDPFPGLRLDLSLADVMRWEERRNKLNKQGCSGTLRIPSGDNATCRLKSAEVVQWWRGLSSPLLKAPPADWFKVVKLLRKRAPKDGKPDPRNE